MCGGGRRLRLGVALRVLVARTGENWDLEGDAGWVERTPPVTPLLDEETQNPNLLAGGFLFFQWFWFWFWDGNDEKLRSLGDS